MRVFLPLTLAAALALSACGPDRDDSNAAATSTDAAMGMDDATASADAPVTADDAASGVTAQGFVDMMASGDMFEIESSKLAAMMAKNAELKAFASMMVADHEKSSAALKAAAGKLNPPITPAAAMDAAGQSDLAELKAAGADFDKRYAERQIAAHEKASAALRSYAATGSEQELRKFAGETARVVELHLQKIRAIQAKL